MWYLRLEADISPFVKQIDTTAKFSAFTKYLYKTYNSIEHDIILNDRGLVAIGSGAYHIGPSVQLAAIRMLRDRDLPTVMVNYDPETASTDYDEADRLHFDNISVETILNINDFEKNPAHGCDVQQHCPATPQPERRELWQVAGDDRSGTNSRVENQPLWEEFSNLDAAADFCEMVDCPLTMHTFVRSTRCPHERGIDERQLRELLRAGGGGVA